MPGLTRRTALLAKARCTASESCRLALFDERAVRAAYRFPALMAALIARLSEQADRAAVRLAVAHLSRVDDRLVGLMKLLAEQWGYVTAAGTVIPLALTHHAQPAPRPRTLDRHTRRGAPRRRGPVRQAPQRLGAASTRRSS